MRFRHPVHHRARRHTVEEQDLGLCHRRLQHATNHVRDDRQRPRRQGPLNNGSTGYRCRWRVDSGRLARWHDPRSVSPGRPVPTPDGNSGSHDGVIPRLDPTTALPGSCPTTTPLLGAPERGIRVCPFSLRRFGAAWAVHTHAQTWRGWSRDRLSRAGSRWSAGRGQGATQSDNWRFH